MKDAAEHSLMNHSHVIVFPPVIPVTGFLLGLAFEWLVPLRPRVSGLVIAFSRVLGAAAFAIGIAGIVWMVVTMRRSGTPIHNARTPTLLVETGPYRSTRNPMYLFGSICYAGLALLLVQPWPFLFLLLVVIVTHYGVVLREEQFLERHFGDAYRIYRQRIPRYF